MSRVVVCFVLASIPSFLSAQVNRYFVSFKDKNNSVYAVSDPIQYLTQKSIDRRVKQNIVIAEEDLPVNATYIQQVKATGVHTYYPSKWFNGVLIESDVSLITSVQNLSCVSNVQLVAPEKKLSNGRVKRIKQKSETPTNAPVNTFQLQQIGLDKMQEDGYHGEGMNVAIFDSGFQGVNVSTPFQHLYTDGRVKAVFNFVNNNQLVYTADDHGTEVLSVMAAYSPGTYVGGIYKANYFLFQTEDVSSEYRIEEYNWAFAAERADSLGVDVINSSLGYNQFDDSSMDYTYSNMDGKTAIITIAASKAIQKGMVVVCSAGNEGGNSWKYVTAPADASGILASGAVNTSNTRSYFSSVGPTADGRTKPDIVALGASTVVIQPSGAVGAVSGTSLASPLIACLATGLWQAYPARSAAEVYATIIHSADQAYTPDNLKGYGLPGYKAAKNYIQYPSLSEDISLFPNPVTGSSLKIIMKEPMDNPLTVTIYDTQGKKLSENTVSVTWQNNPLEYDLSMLSNGVYIVSVKSATISKTVRIVRSN